MIKVIGVSSTIMALCATAMAWGYHGGRHDHQTYKSPRQVQHECYDYVWSNPKLITVDQLLQCQLIAQTARVAEALEKLGEKK